MAVLAPMPSATVNTTAAVKPGFLRMMRSAYLRSRQMVAKSSVVVIGSALRRKVTHIRGVRSRRRGEDARPKIGELQATGDGRGSKCCDTGGEGSKIKIR